MLQFLETGRALYVLAAICGLGILCRWIVRNLYKRLIKESDNMAMTKNRYLKDFKQKSENTYRLNQGIENTKVFMEKQLYNYRFAGLSLNGWGNLAAQLTLLCFLMGGAASFASYWYRCDTYYIVLYSSVGILTGLMTMILDHGINIPEKRNQLLISLQDYLENSMFHRLAREGRASRIDDEMPAESTRSAVRETASRSESKVSEIAAGARRAAPKRVRASAATAPEVKKEPEAEAAGQTDIDFLKKSLEQIAASREKRPESQDWMKNLKPEELQVINEIIREYLA